MAGTTNFTQINPAATNQEADTAYYADTLRSGGITTNAVLPSVYLNKKDYQASTMVTALALALVNKNFSPFDGSPSQTATGLPAPSAAVTDLAAVLANILTTADYAAIASALAAGYAINKAGGAPNTCGYIKLPNFLGNLIIQWGTSDSFSQPEG